MIKAIIFDMNGVLFTGIESMGDKSFHLIVSKKLGVDLDTWIDAIDSSYSKSVEGKIKEKELIRIISDNLQVNEKKLERIIVSTYKKLFNKNKELFKIAKGLKKYYKVAILSDQWAYSKKALVNRKEISSFDLAIFSCDVGMRKPDKKIFNLALRKLKVKPEEAIFIDNRFWNTEPAKKIGIKTILFRNNRQFLRDLKKLGVKYEY